MTYKNSVSIKRNVSRSIVVTFDKPIPIEITHRATRSRGRSMSDGPNITTGEVRGFRYTDSDEPDAKPDCGWSRVRPDGIEFRKDGQARERTTYEWQRAADVVVEKWMAENPDWWKA